ncbi:MAG: serine--tRNA ligase [Fibrobacteria bacterium]|nr:serine--tRNA ligase [Fibrobacteria bacterium]
MLDPRIIREDLDKVKTGLVNKNVSVDLDKLLNLDTSRRKLIQEVEQLKAARNQKSADISKKKKVGEDVSADILATREIGENIKEIQSELNNTEAEIKSISLSIPNLPHASTPVGKSEHDNIERRQWGSVPEFSFKPLDHLEIGERLGLFDFKAGAKISGRGFPVFTGLGAQLERALISYFLDTHIQKNGFTEIMPPLLVNRKTMTGTGQLPKMEADMYRTDEDDLFLIPTAEVPVTNLLAGEVLVPNQLPVSYVAYTPCFRREAGSWGKDTRGFQRLHQFNKVEMVKFVDPATSYDVLETLVGYAEALLQGLGLHYRVLELCTGDLSFAAAKCYDLEAYSPSCSSWLEVSSVSNFEDFQARRANIRVKSNNKPVFVHTLNGSGLATPRVLVAILESYQLEGGGLKIPEVLQPYMGGRTEILPE